MTPRGVLLRVRVAGVLVLLIVALGCTLGVLHVRRLYMERRLLNTWPESAAQDPALVRFATDRAVPVLAAHCSGCHGPDLHGDSRHGAPDLVDKEWLYGEGRVIDIEQTIAHGIRSGNHRAHDLADMPGFLRADPYWRYTIASLSRQEIADLAAFILRLNGRDGDDPRSGARGELLFNKALCYDCHTESAQGDPAIGAPSLRRHAWLFGSSPENLVDVISYGRAGICPAWDTRLSPATIRAIALYLHVQSAKAS